jgi:hypothetical protein
VARQPAALQEKKNGRTGWPVSLQMQDHVCTAA